MPTLLSKLFAEFLGTMLLVATVVGSGIAATNLSDDVGLQLTMNALATVFVLFVLISIFMAYSADFNPAVTIALFIEKQRSAKQLLAFLPVQFLAAFCGAVLANLMFDLDAISLATTERSSVGIYISEVVATFGLVLLILLLLKTPQLIAIAVAFWIGAGYLFTASTSFANPAVSFGRIFSDSFAGIAPTSVLMFFALQLIGAVLAVVSYRILERYRK